MVRIVNDDNIDQVIEEILDYPFWPEGIRSGKLYRVQTDDTDGDSLKGWLDLAFSDDGDAHLGIEQHVESLRFRTPFGGGQHFRVRNALLVLAVALNKDMSGEGNPDWENFGEEG